MSASSSRSTANSPLTMLQKQFAHPRTVAKFGQALRAWSTEEPALSGISDHDAPRPVWRRTSHREG